MTDIVRCISPVDHQILSERALATPQDIEKTLEKSITAQYQWQQFPLAKRQQIIHQALDQFFLYKDDIAKDITWQIGRPISASPAEVLGVIERGRHMVDIADHALKTHVPEASPGIERFIEKEPIGIIAVIAPWNYPYLTAINVIIPALVAGNAVVLKHASQTLLCAERLFDIFSKTELPEGLFQYLHLSHQNTASLLQDRRIGFVNFTGSVPAGHQIQNSISDRFIIAGLELGGKDPAYVRSDANLDLSVENLVSGSFFNSGQSCCGIERIYVHGDLYHPFLERFVETVKKLHLGDPTLPKTTLGPLVKTSAADFVRNQISEAVRAGAIPHIEEAFFPKSTIDTPYLAPQVLTSVDHSMRVMTEESFGPVVGIMKVNSDKEAIQLMNDSNFGLTASIWTADSEKAKTIGRQIQAGTIFMNRCDYVDPSLAWTGVKDTGRGSALSKFGYDSVTRYKSYHLKG